MGKGHLGGSLVTYVGCCGLCGYCQLGGCLLPYVDMVTYVGLDDNAHISHNTQHKLPNSHLSDPVPLSDNVPNMYPGPNK